MLLVVLYEDNKVEGGFDELHDQLYGNVFCYITLIQ